jgi:hypothetical protein
MQGNIQGTCKVIFREHARDTSRTRRELRGTFKGHVENDLGTFSEHSRGMPVTSRERLESMQGSSREPTFRDQPFRDETLT